MRISLKEFNKETRGRIFWSENAGVGPNVAEKIQSQRKQQRENGGCIYQLLRGS